MSRRDEEQQKDAGKGTAKGGTKRTIRDREDQTVELSDTTLATTDHDEILRWAEERNARPARVKGTGGRDDPGILRLDFPNDGPDPNLEPISWDEWFRGFDMHDLAFLYEERTAGGRRSNFNKLVARDTVADLLREREHQGQRRH